MWLGDCWRLGEKFIKMSWVNLLKIAILNNDSALAIKLIEKLPSDFEGIEEMLEAKELLSQLIVILEAQQQDTKKQMLQIKAAKKFINS